MSTTRSQKRKNTQREADDNVSEGFVSPINMENSCLLDQNVELAGPSRPKSPRVENSFLESIRSSLKEEITSEIRALLLESQKEMLKLLRYETKENARDEASEELGNETRNLYTPTKTVRINSTQNEDHSIIRNKVANTDDDTMTQQLSDNQNEDTHDVAPTSPDFSNLTTDVGDNPYTCRPPPIESPPIPQKSPPTVVCYIPRTAKMQFTT